MCSSLRYITMLYINFNCYCIKRTVAQSFYQRQGESWVPIGLCHVTLLQVLYHDRIVYLRRQHIALAHYTNTADSAHTHQESTQQSPCRPTLCISLWEGWVWPWDESWWLAVTLSGVMNWATLQCFAPVGVTSPCAWDGWDDGCEGTCVRYGDVWLCAYHVVIREYVC